MELQIPLSNTSHSYQRLEPGFPGVPSLGMFHLKIFHLAYQRKESQWSSRVGCEKHSTTVRPTHMAMSASEELPIEVG